MANYNDSGFLEEQDDEDVDRSTMDDGNDDDDDNFSEADRSATAVSFQPDSSRMSMEYSNNSDDNHDDEEEDSRETLDDGEEDDATTTEEARLLVEEEEDDESIKSHGTADDVSFTKDDEEISISDQPHLNESTTPRSGKSKSPKKAAAGSSAKKGRTPSVQGLAIPFRTIKKSMKLDPDIPIVQNEAAIMTTMAVELFLKRLAQQAFRNAKNRGRNTVRYEDIAEARTKSKALAFLEPILP